MQISLLPISLSPYIYTLMVSFSLPFYLSLDQPYNSLIVTSIYISLFLLISHCLSLFLYCHVSILISISIFLQNSIFLLPSLVLSLSLPCYLYIPIYPYISPSLILAKCNFIRLFHTGKFSLFNSGTSLYILIFTFKYLQSFYS